MNAALIELLKAHAGQALTPELSSEIAMAAVYGMGEVRPKSPPAPVELERVTIQAEVLTPPVCDELRRIHDLHWQETEGYQHSLGKSVDYTAMIAASAVGRLQFITARDIQSRRLVGNLSFWLMQSVHTGKLNANEDTLFLHPDYRGGPIAGAMLDYADLVLRDLGVELIRMGTKTVNNAHKLLERHGYKLISYQFAKTL